MEESIQTLTAEVEALRVAYAALNRNDVEGFIACFDEQIERIEWQGSPAEGVFKGLDAVRAHVVQGRGTWAEGGCEPERFIVARGCTSPLPAGDRVVVLVHVRVRVKHETEWREGWVADVYTFRNGKAIQFRSFADQREAFEWAGVEG